MTWFNILKFYSPKQFMQDLQEMLGGEYHGGSASSRGKGYYKNPSTSFSYYLQHPDGNIKLETMPDGKFIIRVNGEIVAREYSLKKALEIVKEHLSNIKKSSKEVERYKEYLEDLDMFLEVLGYSEDSYEQEVLRSLRNTLDQLKNPKYKSNPSKYADEIWELESSFHYSADEITMNRVPSFTE
tara:strand:- start:783 stop:1334 length:552 start_codon:yes stop_codon:yes gene_type:complete